MGGDLFFQVILQGEWVNFPKNANQLIVDAYQAGEEKVEFQLKIDGKKVSYTIDFKRMKQTAAFSSKERTVRPPWDLLKNLQGKLDEKTEKEVKTEKTAGGDVDQAYKKKAEEDAAKKKKMEQRAKALGLVQSSLADTAVTKGLDEEKLVAMRAAVAQACRDCLTLGLSEEEIRPLRDRVRKLHNTIQDLKGAIRVYGRTRPFNQREKDTGSKHVLTFPDDKMSVVVHHDDGDQKFVFDTTFAPGTQDDVFAELKDLIQSVYDGYNVTMFVYGQTGSGKTFTMYGPKDNIGVVPKTIFEIFRLQKEMDPATFDISTTFSMVELYVGRFCDLLYKKKEKPPEIELKKNAEGETYFHNALENPATTPEIVWKGIEAGFDGRQVTATAMNPESSRSHLFTILKIKTFNKATQKTINGKITLCDLAGSERVKDSMVEGDALKEAIEINKSLTSLGDVMADISKGGKNVNMRNTPLTAALADSLGGSAKTLMFANLSPASINQNETIMTCVWAMRAKKVTNTGQNKADAKADPKADAKGKAKAKAKPAAKKK